ncbi:MAG: hypothetical protein Q4C56_02885 [Peptococcaceae bacterium]|nr:hypothetical protein [Peptococcaceae bacterium]
MEKSFFFHADAPSNNSIGKLISHLFINRHCGKKSTFPQNFPQFSPEKWRMNGEISADFGKRGEFSTVLGGQRKIFSQGKFSAGESRAKNFGFSKINQQTHGRNGLKMGWGEILSFPQSACGKPLCVVEKRTTI